jgi:DNA segregation ATPase FtsK/SpoIIIE, S-DNA-T family
LSTTKAGPKRKSLRKSRSPDNTLWLGRALGGFLALLSLIGFLGLISFDGVVSGAVGVAFTDLFGRSAWLAMLVLFALGSGTAIGSLLGRDFITGANAVAGVVLIAAVAALIHLSSGLEATSSGPDGGGIVGFHLGWNLQRALGGFGALVILLLAVLGGLTFSLRLPLVSIRHVARLGHLAITASVWLRGRAFRTIDRLEARAVDEEPATTSASPSPTAPPSPAAPDESANGWEQQPLLKIKNTAPAAPASNGTVAPASSGTWQLPGIDLFEPVAERERVSPEEIEENAAIIESTLADFNVDVRVVEAIPGPVVTQYCLSPSAGVKVARISSLANDLSLALSARNVRIEAPIPGRPYVGLEFPNRTPAVVSVREMLESSAFVETTAPLPLALGKNVADEACVKSLSTMPHLLIAGATGAGKSVFLNAVLVSLLYRHSPDDLRLILIDPKMVELVVYNDIPHLKMPVVTRLDEVVSVLAWATGEMTRRYTLLSGTGHRNLETYNRDAEGTDREKLPHLVIVIDELADLMMTAPAEVERYVCRLAQMARAVGIHLVIATQRPSVDVVTGLIKANFPTRVAFMVSSQIDSRTILDSGGAERLVGRGDMLYASADSGKLTRMQGAMATDDEIHRLVRHWAEQGDTDRVSEEEVADAVESGEREDDELVADAVELVRQFNYASGPLLQRELKVGAKKAGKLIVILEERGIVGPEREGHPSREVLVS